MRSTKLYEKSRGPVSFAKCKCGFSHAIYLCGLNAFALRNERSCMRPLFQFCLVKKLVTRRKTPCPSRAVLRAWGRGGVCLKRSRARDVRCRRADVEVLPQEPWRSGGGVGTCRHRGMETWRSGDAPQACRRGSVEVWRSGALQTCCGGRDV